jgi:hypothetical protein
MRRLLKFVGVLLALAFIGGLVAVLWPFTDRSAKGTRPVPMPVAALPNAEPLENFLESNPLCIDAFVIHIDGTVAFSHGDTDVPMFMASARKSVLSLMYGIAWDRGLIDLRKTVGELGIEESLTPLTEAERQATVENLLQSRSGIYLPSGGESPDMRAGRPRRGQYAPGQHFYYNNWDFNVLGTIFESQTGMTVGDALDQWLAQPLGMEDFNPSHVRFDREATTDYPTYRMFMSARDLARLGTLILQNGAWGGKQIISEAWLARSLAASSSFEPWRCGFSNNAYGYSWWLNTEQNAVIAEGWGGQYLYVDRKNKMVLVARCDPGNSMLGFLLFQWSKRSGESKNLLTLRDLALAQKADQSPGRQ